MQLQQPRDSVRSLRCQVLKALKTVGITKMKIYLIQTRMFMCVSMWEEATPCRFRPGLLNSCPRIPRSSVRAAFGRHRRTDVSRYFEAVDEFDPVVDFPRHLELSPKCVEWGKVCCRAGELEGVVQRHVPIYVSRAVSV